MNGTQELMGTHFGYPCRYTPTVMDGPVFRWGVPGWNFEVSASRNGVVVQGGSPLLRNDGPADLCRLLGLAESVHRQLARGVEPGEVAFTYPAAHGG